MKFAKHMAVKALREVAGYAFLPFALIGFPFVCLAIWLIDEYERFRKDAV